MNDVNKGSVQMSGVTENKITYHKKDMTFNELCTMMIVQLDKLIQTLKHNKNKRQ
jgi:hypothetical protein